MWDVSGELLDVLSNTLLTFVPTLVKQRFSLEGAVKGCLKQVIVIYSDFLSVALGHPSPLYP